MDVDQNQYGKMKQFKRTQPRYNAWGSDRYLNLLEVPQKKATSYAWYREIFRIIDSALLEVIIVSKKPLHMVDIFLGFHVYLFFEK
jgi:hypothetical protein